MRILILLICLLLASPAHAVINIYVDTDATGAEDGTNWTDAYTSLADAEAENLDLVTAADSCIIWCRASSGTADTTEVSFQGWTTSADYTLTVTVPESDQHSGVWDDMIYRLEMDRSGYVLAIRQSYLYIDGLQIRNTLSGDSNAHCIETDYSDPTYIYVWNCLIAPGHRGSGITVSDDTAIYDIRNCIIVGMWETVATGTSEGIFANQGSAATGSVTITNCTVYFLDDGIERDTATVTVTNTVVFGCSDDFDGTMTITNCASDDGDGTNAVTLDSTDDYANEFTDITTYDFSLVSGSGCIDAGTSTGAPSTDIIGTSRPQNSVYDIGAFEYISGETPASPLNIQLLFF